MSNTRKQTLRSDGLATTLASATLGLALIAGIGAATIADNGEVRPVAASAPVAAAPAHPLPVTAAPKPVPAPAPAPTRKYADDLDGWIREALDVLTARGIPASYDGILRNAMRESTGNPHAINLYDSNAMAGIPSKGLLQVIDPTFRAFHVEGTSWDIYDPVANIAAACNYAASRYGSMDHVDSAY